MKTAFLLSVLSLAVAVIADPILSARAKTPDYVTVVGKNYEASRKLFYNCPHPDKDWCRTEDVPAINRNIRFDLACQHRTLEGELWYKTTTFGHYIHDSNVEVLKLPEGNNEPGKGWDYKHGRPITRKKEDRAKLHKLPRCKVSWYYWKNDDDMKKANDVFPKPDDYSKLPKNVAHPEIINSKTGKCHKVPRTRNSTRRKYGTVEITELFSPPIITTACALYEEYTVVKEKNGKKRAKCGGKRLDVIRAEYHEHNERIAHISKDARGILCF